MGKTQKLLVRYGGIAPAVLAVGGAGIALGALLPWLFVPGWLGLAAFSALALFYFRRAESEREQARARAKQFVDLEAIYDSAGVGLCVLDTELRFVRVNQLLSQIDGVPAAEHIGRTVRQVAPHLVRAIEPACKRVLSGAGPVLDLEISGVQPPHRRRTWLTQWLPLTGSDGAVRGINVVIEEITGRKQAEEALREADRKKDEFLAMLAHELRNPMAAISAAASLLSRPGLSEERAAFAKDALAQRVKQLARLVEDLLDVSRIAHGKIQLHCEHLAFSSVIERAVEASRDFFEDRRHILTVNISDELPVVGDAVRLEQVITNLLVNAAKYTNPGGRIALEAAREPERAVLRVKDNGIGIPRRMIPKIFQLFGQADGSLHRSSGGLGVGLTIVQKLVEMHGGTVEAHSEGENQGSTFIVRLPLDPAAQPANDSRQLSLIEPGLRILIVEDNKDVALMTAATLELEGHFVELALDGRAGVRAAIQNAPDVILLDIGLPILDGFQVAERVRHAGLHDILIIAVTGYGQERDLERVREAGIDHHLLKPLDYGKLAVLLGRYPRRRHRPIQAQCGV